MALGSGASLAALAHQQLPSGQQHIGELHCEQLVTMAGHYPFFLNFRHQRFDVQTGRRFL